MKEFGEQNSSVMEARRRLITEAFAPGGLAYALSQVALAGEQVLNAGEVGDVIMPPKRPGEDYQARWQLVEGAPKVIREEADRRREEIFALAANLGMRQETSLSDDRLKRIDPAKAIWLVEGGANRTSVVRRALAISAMRHFYKEDDLFYRPLFQFGGDRPIPQLRQDGNQNREYGVAREIASDYLPGADSLTEFDLNVASALQAGYTEVTSTIVRAEAKRETLLHRADSPMLVLVQPEKEEGGLKDAFRHIGKRTYLAGRQFVIATNGQYVPKDELQAEQAAHKLGVTMLPPVALGDEPGFEVEHNGTTIVTAERKPVVYINEFVVLWRYFQR